MTGLPYSGRATIADAFKARLESILMHPNLVSILKSQEIREGIGSNLTYQEEDRHECSRRIGEMTKMLMQSANVCIIACGSGVAEERKVAKQIHEKAGFDHLVCYLDATLEVCESRDTTNIYKKAKAGAVKNFSGISETFEPPQKPEITLSTGTNSIEISVSQIITYLFENNFLVDNSEPWVAPDMIELMTITEKEEIENLPVLEIELE